MPVQPGDQEPEWRAALLQKRHHQRLLGRLAPSTGRQIRCATVELDQFRFTPGGLLDRPYRGAAARERLRRRRMPGRDSTDPGQLGVTVVVEKVGQGERQVVWITSQLIGGEVQDLSFGAHHARVGTQVAQCRHPTLTDYSLGVLADHAEHADHVRVVVAQRAVGERVVRLFRVAGSLQQEHQGLVPGRLPGRQDTLDPWIDCRPRSPPTPRWPDGRAPRGICCPGCRGGRRHCRKTSAPVPMPSTWQTATTAGCSPP